MAFVKRARETSMSRRPRTRLLAAVKGLLIKLVIVVVLLVAAGYAAIQFEVPVAGPIAEKVWSAVAQYLPS